MMKPNLKDKVKRITIALKLTHSSNSVFRVAAKDELKPNSKGRPPFFFPISDKGPEKWHLGYWIT